MATQDETKQCHVCGCLVFLYESGNVAPHYDPHGNKCGANYQLWRERPEAPQPEAEATARKAEGDAGQRKADDGLGPSCLEVAETLIDDFIRDVSLLRDRQDRNELVRRVATALSMQREALKTSSAASVAELA